MGHTKWDTHRVGYSEWDRVGHIKCSKHVVGLTEWDSHRGGFSQIEIHRVRYTQSGIHTGWGTHRVRYTQGGIQPEWDTHRVEAVGIFGDDADLGKWLS